MAGTKKATKKDAATRSRFAAKAAEPVVVNVAVESTISPASEAKIDEFRADMKATRDAMRSHKEPNRKLLHRRVLVRICDSEGTRISDANFDLAKDDDLRITVNDEGIEARTNLASR